MGTEHVIDLLDPDESALRAVMPPSIHDAAVHRLLRPSSGDHDPRPRLESHGDYIFGVLVIPTPDRDAGTIAYQEIDVVLDLQRLVVVRKTPDHGDPYDVESLVSKCASAPAAPGMALYNLFNEVAEHFLDLVDGFNEEIDELEDSVATTPSAQLQERLSALRHDVLHIRRTLSPTRDAARSVLDGRLDLDGTGENADSSDEGGSELFPRQIELHFADAYDKLLRAVDGLDLSRDLISGVRDYHQSTVANSQNEVMKRLTIVSSLLLPPTFVVGLYGQNFPGMPELAWPHGYAFSWAVIIVLTVSQLIYFRRRHWM